MADEHDASMMYMHENLVDDDFMCIYIYMFMFTYWCMCLYVCLNASMYAWMTVY
jgi:hypothetical protein